MWSRGRHFSPSLPGDRYRKLSSQKRSPGRNLGEHRLVRRSGTVSRGTALLVFSLRMRRHQNRISSHMCGKKKNIPVGLTKCKAFTPAMFLKNIRVGSTKCKAFTRAMFLKMWTRLIQFVDENSFEMFAVLKILQSRTFM